MEAELVARDAGNRLCGDPNGRAEHQEDLDKRRDVFNLGVAVGMVFVGGLVGDLDGQVGEPGADEVERGVGGVGQNAERAGKQTGGELEQGDDEGGQRGAEGDRGFFVMRAARRNLPGKGRRGAALCDGLAHGSKGITGVAWRALRSACSRITVSFRTRPGRGSASPGRVAVS